MKLLAIGDFHGKFPEKLKKIAKRKNIDLIVSVGDFMPFSYRKLWFRHCYKTDKELWEVVGKKKVKNWLLRDLKSGEKILRQLDNIAKNIPIISVSGNLDRTKWEDAIDYKKPKWGWYEQDFFTPIIKKFKHIKIFDYSFIKFNEIVFIGMPNTSFSGRVKSKNYKKMRKRLDRLFKKFKNEKIIFVSHNVPYKTRLSKVKSKDATDEVQGIDKGSKLVRRIIESHQPILNLCGHMHENQGKCKIGKTVVINTGAACEGKAAVIEIDEEKGKMKHINFIK